MADMVRLAGIDVSKEKLDVHVAPSGVFFWRSCITA